MKKGSKPLTELRLNNIKTLFKKKVTKFGTGAKIDCPKEYLHREAYVIIID